MSSAYSSIKWNNFDKHLYKVFRGEKYCMYLDNGQLGDMSNIVLYYLLLNVLNKYIQL